MSFPLVISFYTAGTPYEQEIKTLIASCQRFDLETHIEALTPVGSWVENCAMKGPFIRECLKRFERPVLWLDADAEVVRRPVLFDDGEFDVAAYCPTETKLNSGTAYFSSSKASISVASHWADLCGTQPRVWDQVHLRHAIENTDTVRFERLPQGYCKVFDRAWRPGEPHDEYIIHHQASRRLKGQVRDRASS